MAKHPSSMGSVPKSKGGSMRTLDGPGVGRAPGAVDHKSMPMTSHAGGKPLKNMGGGEGKKVSAPKVKTYAQGPQGKQAGGF